MIILTGAEKLFDKMQHPSRLQTVKRLEIQGDFFNIIQDIYKNM